MLAQFLALMLQAAAPAAAPPNTVSPVVVNPLPPPADVRIEMQGSDSDAAQVVAIWPAAAYDMRMDGRVTMRCHIDVHGLAEHCTVVSESPAGRGFGAAALELRPTIKLTPG